MSESGRRPITLAGEALTMVSTNRPSVESQPTATLDLDVALSNVDGDRKLLRELMALFQQTAPMQASLIWQAYRANDADGVRNAAHQLKGSVTIFGANSVYNACRELERQGRSEDLSGFKPGWLSLQHELGSLLRDMRQLLARE